MAHRSFLWVYALSLSVGACGYSYNDNGDSEARAGAGGADASKPLPAPKALPKVGESFENNGTVSAVTPAGADCKIVQITYPAEWTCSEEQMALVRGTAVPAAVPGSTAPAPANGVALSHTDCEGLAELRRPALKQAQRSTLAAQHSSLLRSKCVARSETRYYDGQGRPVSYCSQVYGGSGGFTSVGVAVPGAPQPGSAIPPAPAPSGQDGGGAKEVSGTNTQVIGVDEADFVKNDNEHVYVLTEGALHVIDAWPAVDTREVARIEVLGKPRRMFLDGDRLVVYTGISGVSPNPYGGAAISGGQASDQGCTYGYDCRFTSEGGSTLVLVFDVSDPAAPEELRRYHLSGGFVAARRVGSNVYTVVHDAASLVSTVPGVDLKLAADNPESLELRYRELAQAADSAADSLPAEFFLPWIAETKADGKEHAIAACDSALVSSASRGQSFISLVSFDLDSLGTPTRSLLAAKPGFVYSSASALYLAVDGVDGADSGFFTGSGSSERSTIHKFGLDGIWTRYAGSESIRGHVLNQFSMDEQAGVLRVATSSGRVPAPDTSSNITTLAEGSGRLERRGELTGLAPQEDIRSVRFDGDRGFVVTFKKTDPLFVIDLANADAPRVLGELKIPGFSTYMHRLDDNHLLAVGFDADDKGSFAFFDGIQIQVFDVTDLTNPKLLHKHVIGTRGSGSEGLMNHLAFNYFPSKGVLALPMTICEGGDNGVNGNVLTFSGLMVFDVSVAGGIQEHGRMPFVDPSVALAPTAAGAGCGQWWTNSTSLVKRSLFMDDFAYGISDAELKVAALAELSKVIESVPLKP